MYELTFLEMKMIQRNKCGHDGSTDFAKRRNIMPKSQTVSSTVWHITQRMQRKRCCGQYVERNGIENRIYWKW